MPGLFITFEGSEGCGKSTQSRRLTERLRDEGGEVLTTREPGGTTLGEAIRHLLQHAKEGEQMTAEAELLLFAASRAELVRRVIEPALAAGTHVVSDRFIDSTTVYQGVARGLGVEAVDRVSAFATGGRQPDLTFLIDLPVEIGFERVRGRGQRKDRFESLPHSFFERVRAGYRELADREPGRIVLLDGGATEEELARAIWSHVEERLHGH